MNAYLFAAMVTQWQNRQVTYRGVTRNEAGLMTGFQSAIAFGDDPSQARLHFEEGLGISSENQDLDKPVIGRIVAAQLVGHLFTESGPVALDLPRIYAELEALLQTAALDDFEQGYWVDVNEVVRPDKLSMNVESLKQILPEDIATGLNWSPEKQWFFRNSLASTPPFSSNFRLLPLDGLVLMP